MVPKAAETTPAVALTRGLLSQRGLGGGGAAVSNILWRNTRIITQKWKRVPVWRPNCRQHASLATQKGHHQSGSSVEVTAMPMQQTHVNQLMPFGDARFHNV